MSKLVVFVTGLLIGAYTAQTYNIPKVTVLIHTVRTKISEYENTKPTDPKP